MRPLRRLLPLLLGALHHLLLLLRPLLLLTLLVGTLLLGALLHFALLHLALLLLLLLLLENALALLGLLTLHFLLLAQPRIVDGGPFVGRRSLRGAAVALTTFDRATFDRAAIDRPACGCRRTVIAQCG